MKSPVQIKNLVPLTGRHATKLLKELGVDRIVISAAKGDVWVTVTKNTDALDELRLAYELIGEAQKRIVRTHED